MNARVKSVFAATTIVVLPSAFVSPDLNGWWGGGGGGFGGRRSLADLTDEKGNVTLQLNARSQGSALGGSSGQLAANFERDSGVRQRADPNKPIYKPLYWDTTNRSTGTRCRTWT